VPQTLTPWAVLTSDDKYPEREKSDECDSEVRAAAADLAERVSKLLDELGKSARVSSGFRTQSANKAVGGAKTSNHLTGKAVDLEDTDGSLGRDILKRIDLLATHDLYMENPQYTHGWVHLQTEPTKSGRRVFVP
jgi:hypothetical protein